MNDGSSPRRLRYSERKLLAESGSLGDLVAEAVPPSLRKALIYYTNHEAESRVALQFRGELQRLAARHFGEPDWERILGNGGTDEFLDLCEILIEAGQTTYRWVSARAEAYQIPALAAADTDMNELFDRHRFGFRHENGEMRPVTSPLLDSIVVGPALFAVARPGWEEVERNYREAIQHLRRDGEGRDALTAVNSALESALKAMGFTGNGLGELVRALGQSSLLPGHTRQVFTQLDALLARLNAWRSTEGDAHGRQPGTDEPPRALVALSIHWAGAAIVYLAELAGSADD